MGAPGTSAARRLSASRVSSGHIVAVLGVFLLLAAVAIMLAGRGTTFLIDEWAFVMERVPWDAGSFLEAHNEHISVVQVIVFKFLFEVVGLGSYWPYRLAVLLTHLVCVVLLFLVARRKAGEPVALLVTLPILFLGTSSPLLFYGIDVAWTVPMASLLGIILLIDRKQPAADAACAALLLLALASFTLGICIAAGVAVALLWDRDRWRRLWVAAAPLALYALWYVGYNTDTERAGPLSYSASAIDFALHTAASAVAGLLGLSLQDPDVGAEKWVVRGLVALTIVLAALVVAIVVRRRLLSRDLAMVLTVLLSFWLLLGITRAFNGTGGAYQGRYVYVGAVLIVLVLVELMGKREWPRAAWASAAVVVAVSVLANIYWLFAYGDDRRHESQIVAARLGALELARDAVGRDAIPRFFHPDASKWSVVVNAGGYFDARDALRGSPALSPDEIAASSEAARAAADDVLARATNVRFIPVVGGAEEVLNSAPRDAAPPEVERVTDGKLVSSGACHSVQPTSQKPPTLYVALPQTGMTVRAAPGAPAELRLRRFARSFDGARARPFAEVPQYLSAPGGSAGTGWHARLTGGVSFAMAQDGGRETLVGSAHGVQACPLGGAAPTGPISGGPAARIPVVEGAGEGFVEGLTLERDRVSVSGWAVGPEHGPAERIVVFVDGRFAGSVIPARARADIATGFGNAARRSGFELSAPLGSEQPEVAEADVRVFAVTAGRASELPRL